MFSVKGEKNTIQKADACCAYLIRNNPSFTVTDRGHCARHDLMLLSMNVTSVGFHTVSAPSATVQMEKQKSGRLGGKMLTLPML